jgi:hypothetical protein
MKRLLVLSACVVLLGNLPSAFGQQEVFFETLTAWGRWLYAYDRVCWIATDSVLASHPDSTKLGIYIALQLETQWVVAFGRMDSNHFMFSYEFAFDTAGIMAAKTVHAQPVEAPELWYHAAHAIQTCGAAFGPRSHPFNPMILPQADGTWSVYFVPAETSDDTVYIGSDVRYTVSADGRTIKDTTKFHASLLAMPKPGPDSQLQALVHSHAILPIPSETDVYYVLRQRPRLPHFIGAGKQVFAIEPDGRIRRLKLP